MWSNPEIYQTKAKAAAKLPLARNSARTLVVGLGTWLVTGVLLEFMLHGRLALPGQNPGSGLDNAFLLAGVLVLAWRYWARKARKAQNSIQDAIAMSSVAICICRAGDGSFIYVNREFMELTGYLEHELLGRRAQDLGLWQNPSQFQTLVLKLKKLRKVDNFSANLVSKAGVPKTGIVTASFIEIDDQNCVMSAIRDTTELTHAQEKIELLSNYDPETQLPNRSLFMDRLNQLIYLNGRKQKPVTVIYVGLGGYQGLFDALGPIGSSDVVKELTRRIMGVMRQSDTVARLHRDELAILLGEELKDTDVDLIIDKVNRVLHAPVSIPAGQVSIAANLGIACFPSDGLTSELLLQHSHAAMIQARQDGETFRYFSSSMNLRALERLRIEGGMLSGFAAGDFFLVYQPKYSGDGTVVIGMEALARWKHQEKIIPPDQFIPLAEENGFIVNLGEWVLKEACRQNKQWQLEGLPPLQVSVNISARQLRDNDFVEKVEAILHETELAPSLLELEITESAIMTLTEDIVLKLKRLRETGVSISIDDFGTGYSSLSYLKHLPVNKIKIDRSFVMDIVSDPDDAAIVDAIISIARTLHLGVIAEGVESKDQVDFLIGRLCNEFQGYYFSKPLSHENFAELFRKGNGATPQAPLPASKAGAATGSEPPAEPSRNLYLVEPRKAPCPCENMRDVVELIAPVSPNDRIITVLGRFQQEKDLRLIPVVEEDVVVGVVNRSVFLEDHIIGRHGFGIHINHTKKIRDLMEPVEMTLDSEMLVENAAMHLQPMLGNMRIDNICISQDGKYLGVINISRFIKAMTEVQIVLAKGANPLTGLPGNTSIEREICKRLESGLPFEIAYFDMDNFKPFNDHYGFQKGDEVIQRLGEILTATVAGTNSFCGHIGGDDFILITDPHKAEIFCRMVIAAFEAERPVFHGPDDVASGGYRALNRKGELESFPLISLSVGIVNTSRSMVESYARLASLSTEVKKSAKKKHGSSIVIDGRSAPGGSPVRPLSSPDAAEPHRSVTPAAAANL